jgi:DNA-binding NarL/FixJ family response regulator
MKLSAISPRAISFNQAKPQTIFPAVTGRTSSAHMMEEYRELRSPRLTPRELEVLALLCEGMSNKLISRRLNISDGTVKIHVGKILAQLGVSSRLQAVVAAHRDGLIANEKAGANGEPEDHQPLAARSSEQHALRAA